MLDQLDEGTWSVSGSASQEGGGRAKGEDCDLRAWAQGAKTTADPVAVFDEVILGDSGQDEVV